MPQTDKILEAFSCPRDCHLFEASYVQLINCPFGHSSTDNDEPNLKQVAAVACVADLLGTCEQSVLEKVDSEQYWRCSDGLHFEQAETVEELEQHFIMVLMNLEENENDVTAASTHECAVCLQPINGLLGQLSDCDHLFCARCIIDWFKNSHGKKCPICRTASIFVLPTQSVIYNKDEKVAVHELQKEALRVSAPTATPVSLDARGLDINPLIRIFSLNNRRI